MPATRRNPAGPRITLLGILILVTFVAFDSLAIATAMPAIATELDAGGAYALAFAMFLSGSLAGHAVAGGWIDLKGPAPGLFAGVTLFVVGMIGCALASSLGLFLLSRAVSGVGAGMLMVAIYVLIAAVYAEEHRPRVFSWVSAAWILPALVGPAIAGWLTTAYTWRLVFWIGVPFALIAAAVLGPAAVHAPRPEPGDPIGVRRRAVRGFVLAGAATALPWSLEGHGLPTWLRVLGAALAVGVLLRLLPALLPPGTLTGARGRAAAIAFRGLIGGAYFGAEAYIPLAVHSQRGMSLTEAGLALTAASIGWAAGAWVQGRNRSSGAERASLLVWGGVNITVGIVLLPLVMVDAVSPWFVVAIWAFAATGMGLSIATTSVVVMALSQPHEQGRDGAALQLAEGLGSVFGVSLAGLVYSLGHDRGHDPATFSALWLLLACFAALAVVCARRVRPDSRSAV